MVAHGLPLLLAVLRSVALKEKKCRIMSVGGGVVDVVSNCGGLVGG